MKQASKRKTAPRKRTEGSRLTSVFSKAFAKLNPQQRLAVDTIEGPVMCVAGPGTGKTEVVALRVANILKKTHMRPSNILCLTFSTSGATAMRERLRHLIGPDAYGVTVKNFHSFCNDLILEYPLVFDAWSALEQISEVERYREINKVIDQLPPDHVLVSKKRPYGRTRDLLERIAQLKREWKTDRKNLLRVADEYHSVMEGKSKPGTKQHEKNLLAARKFREFLEVFFRYQEMLEKTQRYDYEDMILYVIRALEEEEWLLASLQERYQYILVDEFQDTNGAQYRLVELLTTYPTLDHDPNLFVVGDDDQAIYRFQGANLANILSFHERFPKAPVIALMTSYRSTQPILDAAGSLIANNTERLVGKIDGLKKDLAAAGVTEPQLHPTLLLSPSDMTEPWMVADFIDERLRDGVAPKEIAILVQTNKELFQLYDVLMARSIPVELSGKVDLLSRPLVQQTIAILRAVQNPHESGALATALGCECFDCHPADLGRIFALRREQKCSLHDVLLDLDVSGSDAASLTLCDRDSVIRARDTILDLHNKLGSRTVVETLERVMKDCGLLVLVGKRKPETRNQKQKNKSDIHSIDVIEYAALQEFFDRFKYRAYEDPHFSFETFLSDLAYYENPDYAALRLSYNLPHLTEDGVQLMTAHQSKGQEFEVVILANFRDGHWDKRRNPSSLSVPEDLLFGWEKDQKTYEKHQDERRLAYVAMTRAKRELIFTCPKQLTTGDKMRDVSPSGFFAESGLPAGASARGGELPEEERELLHPEHAATLLITPERSLDKELQAFLKERLENYALSVTALNHFLQDPQMFLEIDLLQTPQSKESSLVYGNAVHEALRKWALGLQSGDPLDEKGFLDAFRAYLDTREILTEKEKQRLLKLGEESLPRYFEQRIAGRHPYIRHVEYPVTTRLGDIPIKGKIDRIDLEKPDSSNAIVIDYKTGAPKTEKEIREGDYFRQLVFYALLLENKPLNPVSFVLDFIGEGSAHPVERQFTIAQQDKEELRKIIEQVLEKILALDFTSLD